MITKDTFLIEYRAVLLSTFGWANDRDKLNRFMESVAITLNVGGPQTWDHHGEAVARAWRNIGAKGKPTLKAMRALP